MSVADNIGLITNCSLWVFGNPYKCANLEPEGLTESAMVFGRILRTMESRIFSFCSRGWQYLDGLPLVLGFCRRTAQNLLVSLIEASDSNRKYSVLSKTTTPEIVYFNEAWKLGLLN